MQKLWQKPCRASGWLLWPVVRDRAGTRTPQEPGRSLSLPTPSLQGLSFLLPGSLKESPVCSTTCYNHSFVLTVSFQLWQSGQGHALGKSAVAVAQPLCARSQGCEPCWAVRGWSGAHGQQTLHMCPSPGHWLTLFLLGGSDICALMLISIN